jgi:hypothetical protein
MTFHVASTLPLHHSLCAHLMAAQGALREAWATSALYALLPLALPLLVVLRIVLLLPGGQSQRKAHRRTGPCSLGVFLGSGASRSGHVQLNLPYVRSRPQTDAYSLCILTIDTGPPTNTQAATRPRCAHCCRPSTLSDTRLGHMSTAPGMTTLCG